MYSSKRAFRQGRSGAAELHAAESAPGREPTLGDC